MQAEITQSIPSELERAISDTGLAAGETGNIAAGFAPHFVAFRKVSEKVQAVVPTAPNAARTARAVRLELKAIRVAAEHTRKSLKEESLRKGRAIDGIKALLDVSLVPLEEAMDAIERAEEIRETARRQALKESRTAELAPFADPTFYDLGGMPEPQWLQLLAGAQAAKAASDEAARRAEAERVENERVAAEARAQAEAQAAVEQERLRAENERLIAAEAAAAAERAAAEAREAAAREEARKAQAEADRLAAEKVAAEQAEAARQQAEQAAARAAAAAPDKDKLLAFATSVRALSVPALASEPGLVLQPALHDRVEALALWIERAASDL